jgi:hypothetical protein
MLGAKPQLEALGNVYVDAAVSRQFPAIIQIFKDLRDQGRLAEVAVVHTGTNGFVTAGQFDELMDVLKNTKRVIIFNTRSRVGGRDRTTRRSTTSCRSASPRLVSSTGTRSGTRTPSGSTTTESTCGPPGVRPTHN